MDDMGGLFDNFAGWDDDIPTDPDLFEYLLTQELEYELRCAMCGRMIQIDNDPPGMRVLIQGNRHARHNCSIGGLIGSAKVRQSDPWDELLDKINFEELWREP